MGQPPAHDCERSQAAGAVDHLPGLARGDADRADRLPGRRARVAEDCDDHHSRVRAPLAERRPGFLSGSDRNHRRRFKVSTRGLQLAGRRSLSGGLAAVAANRRALAAAAQASQSAPGARLRHGHGDSRPLCGATRNCARSPAVPVRGIHVGARTAPAIVPGAAQAECAPVERVRMGAGGRGPRRGRDRYRECCGLGRFSAQLEQGNKPSARHAGRGGAGGRPPGARRSARARRSQRCAHRLRCRGQLSGAVGGVEPAFQRDACDAARNLLDEGGAARHARGKSGARPTARAQRRLSEGDQCSRWRMDSYLEGMDRAAPPARRSRPAGRTPRGRTCGRDRSGPRLRERAAGSKRADRRHRVSGLHRERLFPRQPCH